MNVMNKELIDVEKLNRQWLTRVSFDLPQKALELLAIGAQQIHALVVLPLAKTFTLLVICKRWVTQRNAMYTYTLHL